MGAPPESVGRHPHVTGREPWSDGDKAPAPLATAQESWSVRRAVPGTSRPLLKSGPCRLPQDNPIQRAASRVDRPSCTGLRSSGAQRVLEPSCAPIRPWFGKKRREGTPRDMGPRLRPDRDRTDQAEGPREGDARGLCSPPGPGPRVKSGPLEGRTHDTPGPRARRCRRLARQLRRHLFRCSRGTKTWRRAPTGARGAQLRADGADVRHVPLGPRRGRPRGPARRGRRGERVDHARPGDVLAPERPWRTGPAGGRGACQRRGDGIRAEADCGQAADGVDHVRRRVTCSVPSGRRAVRVDPCGVEHPRRRRRGEVDRALAGAGTAGSRDRGRAQGARAPRARLGAASQYAHIVHARVDLEEWSERARRAIDRSLSGLRDAYPDVPVETRVLHGQPARVLQRLSAEADLLLLARRHRAFPLGHLGGTARALLREGECPVEVVPPADEPTDLTDLVLEQAGAREKSILVRCVRDRLDRGNDNLHSARLAERTGQGYQGPSSGSPDPGSWCRSRR